MRKALAATAVCVAQLLAAAALAGSHALMKDEHGVAANGYDVVAYFDNRATRGIPDFQVEYRGAVWYFETPENAARFQRDPSRYEPVFGGYCAYGVSQGYLVKTDPHAWSVVDGRLYLNYNATVRNRWLADVTNYIAVAERHWPNLTQ